MPGLDVLKQYLRQVDEVQLLELLDISTEDLLNAFEEKVIARRKYLEKEVEILPMTDEDHEANFDHDETE
jgi:hypothetical protein